MHNEERVGLIIVSPPSFMSKHRHEAFGRTFSGSTGVKYLNENFCNLSRIVLDPRYRGASIMTDFMINVIHDLPFRYIELVTSMGKLSRYQTNAGFKGFGRTAKTNVKGIRPVSKQSISQSCLSTMEYFLIDKKRWKPKIELYEV